MKRSLFLLGVTAPALLAATPRLAGVPAEARVRVVRRSKLRRGAPGGCANHRVKARWSSFTAADFHPAEHAPIGAPLESAREHLAVLSF